MLGVISEVLELLPQLRLFHVASVVGDLYAARADELESGGEEALDSAHFVLDDPEEHTLAEQDRQDRIVWNRTKAAAHFAATARSLGLDPDDPSNVDPEV